MDAEHTKPMQRLRNALTFGNLWLYILSLAKNRKKIYAYNLPERLEKQFSFKPSRVMIYIVLYKLEAEGIISSEFEERRKYYHLTEKGKKTLGHAKEYLSLLAERL